MSTEGGHLTAFPAAIEDRWTLLAQRLWLGKSPGKVAPEVLKAEIWDVLQADSFSLRSLVPLESLQILEKYLWPTFTENASNYHVLLIAIFTDVKQRGHLETWDLFSTRPDEFAVLFRRILSLNLDTSIPASSRLPLLSFVIGAFQSIEKGLIRKECAPLVSIGIWNNLQSESVRQKIFEKNNSLRKSWRAYQKRFGSADPENQARLRFEQRWLCSMLLELLRRLNDPSPTETAEIIYCERFLEFLIDLVSQLPTRRYTNTLIKDLNFLSAARVSALFKEEKNILFRDLVRLLQHFVAFSIDDHAGQLSPRKSVREVHYEALARLQRIALQHFEKKLKVLALSNYASIDQRSELEAHFSNLTDEELERLCNHLGFRTVYPKSANVITGREFFLETLCSAHERTVEFQEVVSQLSVLPTEEILYDPALLRSESYDGSRPLAIPKLNLQYLTLGDFLWRSFILHRSEAFYEIRKEMESIVKRMRPRPGKEKDSTVFEGFSKMAISIEKPAIIEVGPAKVGSTTPAFVRAEVAVDVSRLAEGIRREWESLRPMDVVFLLAVKAQGQLLHMSTNGRGERQPEKEWELAHIRTAEVVQVLDENGRPLHDAQNIQLNGFAGRPRRRRILLNVDAATYKSDIERVRRGRPDIYSFINVIARRQARENNFKPVLDTVQKLVNARTELPEWFQEVFLGYGDPQSASYTQLPDKRLSLDFRDTFIDWQHLQESFPVRGVVVTSDQQSSVPPPYILQLFGEATEMSLSNPKKRRREQMEGEQPVSGPVRVSTYEPPNTGPYPMDAPKINQVRFTPKQVEAIVSGTQPGLSVIVGPPGTGKTDVATQIINLLYHNFPQERILLVAHSNQALNQLFQKIIALDIDTRHLLRLGHGEEDLETEASYSKYGRVESFLENRQTYLAEVTRLADTIGAEGAHGNSCETAEYFNQVYIKPAWKKFWDIAKSDRATPDVIAESFPFAKYFSNAPVPSLFPPGSTVEQMITVASGCEFHISKIFTELESIRPFEILRHGREQANHLLVKEARIIAMTSTHAAMRRSEIADLGFHYDSLVMEEAAQITEIESFIPCTMQKPDPKSGVLPLKRVVLVGDHLQNSPVVQNMAFRQFANFDQSLFLRLVRLGVPTINLDRQGRCRPSIADLFKWRYANLGNLPHLMQYPEFLRANAGFRYDYQFVDVPDYQGEGEREPSSHFIQNLGEAEYAVALFQYMRLLGYSGRSISILATYAGQKALIQDVLSHRCKGNRLFGLPRIVTTVDKYQGEQNDYIILSLTRTRSVGYLRDVRRLTVALSRARLGLYILGRRELFETCPEFKPAMSLLMQRPDKLIVTTGEMFPTARKLDDDMSGTEMDGVEHLGQYVYQMTQAKIQVLGRQGVTATEADGQNGDAEGEDVEDGAQADEVDEDPLHEAV